MSDQQQQQQHPKEATTRPRHSEAETRATGTPQTSVPVSEAPLPHRSSADRHAPPPPPPVNGWGPMPTHEYSGLESFAGVDWRHTDPAPFLDPSDPWHARAAQAAYQSTNFEDIVMGRIPSGGDWTQPYLPGSPRGLAPLPPPVQGQGGKGKSPVHNRPQDFNPWSGVNVRGGSTTGQQRYQTQFPERPRYDGRRDHRAQQRLYQSSPAGPQDIGSRSYSDPRMGGGSSNPYSGLGNVPPYVWGTGEYPYGSGSDLPLYGTGGSRGSNYPSGSSHSAGGEPRRPGAGRVMGDPEILHLPLTSDGSGRNFGTVQGSPTEGGNVEGGSIGRLPATAFLDVEGGARKLHQMWSEKCSHEGFLCLRLRNFNPVKTFGPNFANVALSYGVSMYKGIFCVMRPRQVRNFAKFMHLFVKMRLSDQTQVRCVVLLMSMSAFQTKLSSVASEVFNRAQIADTHATIPDVEGPPSPHAARGSQHSTSHHRHGSG